MTRPRDPMPAFLYAPPPSRMPWPRAALRIVGVLIAAWMIAVGIIWLGCVLAGTCS